MAYRDISIDANFIPPSVSLESPCKLKIYENSWSCVAYLGISNWDNKSTKVPTYLPSYDSKMIE